MISINIPVEGVISEIDIFEKKIRRELVRTLFTELVDATPIDTGRARASWVVDNHGTKKPKRKGTYGYPSMPPVPQKDPVYIYNTAPYIVHLNNGHSQQASPMFIERAIDNALRRINAL